MRKVFKHVLPIILVMALAVTSVGFAADVYTVKEGDFLKKIAEEHQMSWEDLAKINDIKNPNLIFAGQELKLVEKDTYTTQDLNEQLVMATLWMQKSAEYRALCYQTFQLAQMQVDAFIEANKDTTKPMAIIVDADETVIDNSAFEAHLIGQNYGYGSSIWAEWMSAAEATALPGAQEFLTYCKSKNVEVFYVTNRKMVGYKGTEKNLKELGFPNVDEKHLMLRTKESSKTARRKAVTDEYNVILLMGDNLNDFSEVFEHQSVKERLASTDAHKDEFGMKWIVLPNPTYGEWEGSIYDYNWGATPAEKDQMRKEQLNKWK